MTSNSISRETLARAYNDAFSICSVSTPWVFDDTYGIVHPERCIICLNYMSHLPDPTTGDSSFRCSLAARERHYHCRVLVSQSSIRNELNEVITTMEECSSRARQLFEDMRTSLADPLAEHHPLRGLVPPEHAGDSISAESLLSPSIGHRADISASGSPSETPSADSADVPDDELDSVSSISDLSESESSDDVRLTEWQQLTPMENEEEDTNVSTDSSTNGQAPPASPNIIYETALPSRSIASTSVVSEAEISPSPPSSAASALGPFGPSAEENDLTASVTYMPLSSQQSASVVAEQADRVVDGVVLPAKQAPPGPTPSNITPSANERAPSSSTAGGQASFTTDSTFPTIPNTVWDNTPPSFNSGCSDDPLNQVGTVGGPAPSSSVTTSSSVAEAPSVPLVPNPTSGPSTSHVTAGGIRVLPPVYALFSSSSSPPTTVMTPPSGIPVAPLVILDTSPSSTSDANTIREWRRLMVQAHTVCPEQKHAEDRIKIFLGQIHKVSLKKRNGAQRFVIDAWRSPKRFEGCAFPAPVAGDELFVDASTSWGIGIIWRGQYLAWKWQDGWQDGGQRDIMWAELIALHLGILTAITSGYTASKLVVRSDNTGVVQAFNSGSFKATVLDDVVRDIRGVLSDYALALEVKWVSSENNPADNPSRGVFPAGMSVIATPPDIPQRLSGLLQLVNAA